MTKKFEIYKCEICKNVVEILCEGVGELVCCGQPMKNMEAQSEETMGEKHKPVLTVIDKDVTIKIGEIPHPMTKDHHIEFIEAISLDGKYLKRKYLNPEETAELKFVCNSNTMKARELCNLHGLWETIKE